MRIFVAGALLGTATLCGSLTSCASVAPGGSEDYIGPALRQVEQAQADAATPSVGEPPAPAPTPAPTGPLPVTVDQAILLTLQNNRSLVVERFNPRIRRTFEAEQRAAFDPDLTGEFAFARARSDIPSDPVQPRTLAQNWSGQLGLSEFLPTGTTLGLSGIGTYYQHPSVNDATWSSALNVSATQALLRGFGLDVNLAALRQARLDTRTSQYELRGFAEALIGQTEETYWDYALALRQIEIVKQSLAIAQQQLDETRERIRLGKLAETELIAAEAELALRREDLINAQSTLDRTRLQFLRLLNPGEAPFDREVVLLDSPAGGLIPLDLLPEHLEMARRMRPDLNQARLLVQRGELDLVRTRNGLLPRMDLFVRLGRTGYASSFGGSISELDGSNYDVTAGVDLEYPLFNRAAEARHARATLGRNQAEEAVRNLAQLIEVDVRGAYIEVLRAREQVAATAASRRLQEAKRRTETEKFRIGRSTAFLVAQAQRDLLSSQINEVQALISYRKAFVALYRLEGSLLLRHGIQAPGTGK